MVQHWSALGSACCWLEWWWSEDPASPHEPSTFRAVHTAVHTARVCCVIGLLCGVKRPVAASGCGGKLSDRLASGGVRPDLAPPGHQALPGQGTAVSAGLAGPLGRRGATLLFLLSATCRRSPPRNPALPVSATPRGSHNHWSQPRTMRLRAPDGVLGGGGVQLLSLAAGPAVLSGRPAVTFGAGGGGDPAVGIALVLVGLAMILGLAWLLLVPRLAFGAERARPRSAAPCLSGSCGSDR